MQQKGMITMDPLDREMLDQLRDTRTRVSRNRATAQTWLALVGSLFALGTVLDAWPDGAVAWITWVAVGLGFVALALALLANRVRTRTADDEVAAPIVDPGNRPQARHEYSGELGHLRGIARLQAAYITGAVIATMIAFALVIIYNRL